MMVRDGAQTAEHQNVVAGIGLMLLGFLIFSVNDALSKWLATTYSPGQILLVRGLPVLAVLVPLVLRTGIGSLFAVDRPILQGLRVVFATAEIFLFYWAVSVLPLADAITCYLAGPIYTTLLAVLFLRERIGWRRWAAVMVGFGGVVIALQPTAAVFGRYALIALAGSVTYAVFMVITRSLRRTPGLTMVTWQFICSVVAGLIFAPFNWVPFTDLKDALMIGLLGGMALIAIVCVNSALKLAPASVVVPYQNTMILWAMLFGYLAFGDQPGLHLIAGVAIIVAACLYIFYREQKA